MDQLISQLATHRFVSMVGSSVIALRPGRCSSIWLRRGSYLRELRRLVKFRYRPVTTWIALLALWLQAVTVPLEATWAASVGVAAGPGAAFCTTQSASQKQKPEAPREHQHQHNDCCLTGTCGLSHAVAQLTDVRWISSDRNGAIVNSRPARAVPPASPPGARPFTTGPPALA